MFMSRVVTPLRHLWGIMTTFRRGLVDEQTDNEYRDGSVRDDQFCFNCTNFIPADDASRCGTCRTVKGPINPGGWCTAWTEAR